MILWFLLTMMYRTYRRRRNKFFFFTSSVVTYCKRYKSKLRSSKDKNETWQSEKKGNIDGIWDISWWCLVFEIYVLDIELVVFIFGLYTERWLKDEHFILQDSLSVCTVERKISVLHTICAPEPLISRHVSYRREVKVYVSLPYKLRQPVSYRTEDNRISVQFFLVLMWLLSYTRGRVYHI